MQIRFQKASAVDALVYFVQHSPSQLTPLIAKACLDVNNRVVEKKLEALADDEIEIQVMDSSTKGSGQPDLNVKSNCIRLG